MSNHIGDMMTLSTSPTRLTQDTSLGARHLTLRAGPWNAGSMYFGKNATEITGILLAGEAAEFWNTRPYDIFVHGTATDNCYWHGDSA